MTNPNLKRMEGIESDLRLLQEECELSAVRTELDGSFGWQIQGHSHQCRSKFQALVRELWNHVTDGEAKVASDNDLLNRWLEYLRNNGAKLVSETGRHQREVMAEGFEFLRQERMEYAVFESARALRSLNYQEAVRLENSATECMADESTSVVRSSELTKLSASSAADDVKRLLPGKSKADKKHRGRPKHSDGLKKDFETIGENLRRNIGPYSYRAIADHTFQSENTVRGHFSGKRDQRLVLPHYCVFLKKPLLEILSGTKVITEEMVGQATRKRSLEVLQDKLQEKHQQ